MAGIYRCSDGHLFQRGFWATLFEANLGPRRHLGKCPVDGNMTSYTRVNPDDLSEAERAQVFRSDR